MAGRRGTCVHVVLEQKLTSTRESSRVTDKYEGIVAPLLNPDDYTILYYTEGRVGWTVHVCAWLCTVHYACSTCGGVVVVNRPCDDHRE
jgi:hypothetical protein